MRLFSINIPSLGLFAGYVLFCLSSGTANAGVPLAPILDTKLPTESVSLQITRGTFIYDCGPEGILSRSFENAPNNLIRAETVKIPRTGTSKYSGLRREWQLFSSLFVERELFGRTTKIIPIYQNFDNGANFQTNKNYRFIGRVESIRSGYLSLVEVVFWLEKRKLYVPGFGTTDGVLVSTKMSGFDQSYAEYFYSPSMKVILSHITFDATGHKSCYLRK